MAKTFSLSKSSDGQSVVAARQENPNDVSYEKWEESHPNPEQNNYNVVMPESQSTPQSESQPTAQQATQIQVAKTGNAVPTTTTAIMQEPEYNYNAHFSQQWFLDEQENRKNPEYVKQGTDIMDDDTFNAIADAIKIRKEANPNQWVYGDPGWKTDTTLYQDYIKPMEEKYRQQIHNAQIAEMSKTTYDDVMATTKFNPSADAGVSTEKGDFENLSTFGKINNLFMPGQAGTDITNQPGIAKYTQPIAQSVASSGGVANIARDIAITAGVPFVGWVYGGVKAADFTYNLTKAYGLHSGNKVYDKIKEIIDMPDEKMQQALGALDYAFAKVCGGDLADSTKIVENVGTLIDNFDEVWDYAYGSKKASTEYDSDIVGLVMGATANMGATPLIGDFADRAILNLGSSLLDEDPTYIDYGQTTRYNLGQAGAWDIPEEMLGSNAPAYWLKTVQGWRNEGKATDIQDLTYLFWNKMGEVYGDKANWSEYTEHEFVDPSNTLENMETRGINLYAKATHDTNLEIASAPGSLVADLTENIPGIGLIRTIGQTISGDKDFLKTSNGINEVLAAWDMENISNPTDQLTARDRRFSGITEEGTLNRMNPNPDKVLTGGRVGEFIANATNLLRKTDETKASYEGDAIFDYINVMVDDAIRARGDEDINTTVQRLTEFVDELEHPENISTDSPFYKSSQSALFTTVKNDVAEAVRLNRQEILAHIEKFRNLDNNRNVLNTVSSALNMTPHQFMEKYNNDRVTLAQMIVNKANENGGTISGIDVPIESKDFGTAVLDMLKPFAGDDGQAYDVRQLGLQMTSSLADGISKMLVQKYNIQPEGMLYRFGDMIKKMQSLVLLGLSPSYLANNFINNVATRTALGYGGYLTSNTINDWMSRFGFSPERLQESFTQDYLGVTNAQSASGKLQSQIKQARKKVDGKGIKKDLSTFMEKTGDLASSVNEKVGVFSNLSGKVEESESKQVSVSAMMTYMARTWKPGVNFRKMSIQLESAINSQCPGMADAIYKAIGNGMNMAEIEKAIFGTFIAPSVKDTLVDAAKSLNMERPEDIVTEYFAKGGMLEQLNKALEGRRGDEIDRIVNDYGDYLKKILAVQLSDNIKNKAKAVQQDVGNIGFASALEWANDISNDMLEVWLNSQDVNTSIFQKRLWDNMSAREFHALYQEHLKNLNEQWQAVYRQSEQVWNGILKGLNIKGRNEISYVSNLHKKNQVWANFYEKTQPKLFQPYLDALEWKPSDTQETWDARVQKAWNTYINAVQKAVQKVYEKESDYQTKMDNAFLAGLKKSLGATKASEVDTTIVPLMEEVENKRAEIIERVREVREVADNTKNLYEKNEAWHEAESNLKQAKQDYVDKQQELYNAVKEIGKNVYDNVADTQKDPADIEASIQVDVAEEQADKHQKEAEKFAEVMVDAALSGELDNIDSTAPTNWKTEINRKNLREVAMKAGATKKQADAYARYVGAVARAWERKHPGKDFFTDKLGLSIEYVDEDNISYQESEQRIKGEFKIEDGEKLVQLFRGSDFSTLVHETMGHGFSTTLERNQQEALAAYNGWTLLRYRQLEYQFYNDPDSMDTKDKQDWVYAQERFAYGFEQYLMEGIAPNDGIRSVFESFRQFLLDIYQGIRKLVYKGEEIDIHKKQNGITLAEIFDSMLDGSQTRGHKWQGETQFNITGQENFQRGEGESESFGTIINDNNRQFFQSESERQLEKVIKVKQAAENKLRGDVADYVNDLSKKWNLTPEESEELIVETMHRMGLNQNLQENPVLKRNVELKMGKYDRRQTDKFVRDHMPDAVKIDDKAIDALLKDNVYYGQGDYSFGYSFGQTDQNSRMAWEARQQQAQIDFQNGKYVPIEYIDLTTIEPLSSRDTEVKQLAGALFNLYNADLQTRRENGEKVPHYENLTLDDFIMYIYDTKDKLNNRVLDDLKYQQIFAFLQFEDDGTYRDTIEALRTNSAKTDPLTKRRQPIPANGTYVAQTYSSEYGQYEIVGTVTHNGRIVAYVPSQMPLTEVQIDDDHKVRILGVDITNPEQLVYLDGEDVKKQKIREDDGTNSYQGEMERNSLGALDPVAEAHYQMSYEQVLPILEEFKRLYKQNLDNNMTNQNYNKLKPETRSELRGYIDTDIRTDLANAKFKAGKYGNLIRDAALLNYNNRYGFDNAFTLLCPYQFWQSRSFLKWISRMGSKGSRMWRRYAKLLQMTQRNQKEYMPSRVSGMFGLYLPFLPEWAGNSAFVSADQFLVVPQFISPVLDYFEGNNAVTAVAERNLQEALRDEKISYKDYQMAIDPATRPQSAVWQEYYSKAQITEGADKNLADMFGQYFGLSLPLSIYKAVSRNDSSEWNQWPITRTGTAWRATFGDNFIGNLGQDVLSAPEKAIRKAVTAMTGDDSFQYNEFGAFADYYIRQQVWDMVAEGRIGPDDAIQAVTEKDGNKIWEEAADRQREELLMKMQFGMPVDAVKRLVSGEGDPVDNWKMLLAGLVTAPTSKQVVREGESIWREQKEGQSEAYDAYYAGDKEALNKFDEKNPNYRYNNLRYESDPEQSLRKYLYNNITQNWYKLDKAEKNELNMSFNSGSGDFYADVLNKDTRAIESMDLNRLVAYAQALNGKIPNLATDKINLQNIQPINVVDFPQTTLDKVNQYYQEMNTLYPGMDKVEDIYYALPPEERKAFGKTQPNLYKMWDWKKQYKKDNPDVANFLKLSSASYDIRDAEEVMSLLDDLTIRELKYNARSGGTPDKAFQPLIESAMKKAGITDKYSDYLKDLYKYILGE